MSIDCVVLAMHVSHSRILSSLVFHTVDIATDKHIAVMSN